MTQYILREAASTLEDNVFRELDALDGRIPPRILTTMVGHDGFAEHHLGLDLAEMRERWPDAGGWYSDLIAYLLHQALVEHRAERRLITREALACTLGELVERQIVDRVSRHSSITRLAAVVQSLWPTSPTVRAAHSLHAQDVLEHSRPGWASILGSYRLRLRDGADLAVLTWCLDAFAELEMRETHPGTSPGSSMLAAAWLTAMGAVEDADTGRPVTVEELQGRRAS